MLDTIGVGSLDELFASIPEKHRLTQALDLAGAVSEQELMSELSALAGRNANLENHAWFLGAGVYPHFVPSAVDALVSRSEFTTAYTPYQPEISQGTLQAIFEWQTMICGLTGCEVANASMYDGASATAEAALMAMRTTRRNRVVAAGTLHPHTREVLGTYLDGLGAEIADAPRAETGRTAPLAELVDDTTACVILQQPNFRGIVEDVRAAATAHGARRNSDGFALSPRANSTASTRIVPAIASSTGAAGRPRKPSAANESVTLWPTVKLVTVQTSIRVLGTRSTSPSTKSRWSRPSRMCRKPSPRYWTKTSNAR